MTIHLCRLSFFSMVLLSSCTWISDSDYQTARQAADDDGDGSPKADDCDDLNPNISPLIEETWYNGVDENCNGDNDFDQDGDGSVPTEHAGKLTNGDLETGLLPGGDCNDLDPESYPDAPDSPYDGIDSNCSGNDDYDQDEDGYVPDQYVGLATENIEESGSLPGGDCNDGDPNISPNPSVVDIPYDGIDTNCDNLNDYDQDEDGYSPPEYTIDGLLSNDCDDLDPAINPGATEEFYDGIDSDCNFQDDYDQDLDGYVPSIHIGKPTAAVDGTGNLPGGDCDDQNASRYVGAIEDLGDSQADYDCDICPTADSCPIGNGQESFRVNTSEWLIYTSGLSGSNPRDVEYSVSEDAATGETTLFVSSLADVVTTINPTNNTAITYYSAAFVTEMDYDDLLAGPTSYFRWRGKTDDFDPYPYSQVQSTLATDELFVGVIGQDLFSYRSLRLSAKKLTQTYYFHIQSRTTGSYPPFEDVSLMLDSNDVLHAVGCESGDGGSATGSLQYARIPLSYFATNSQTSLEFDTVIDNFPLNHCQLTESNGTGELVAVLGNDLTRYSFPLNATTEQDLVFTPTSTTVDYSPLSYEFTERSASGIEVFSDISGIYAMVDGIEYQVKSESNPGKAAPAYTEDGQLVIGYTTFSGEAKLLIGDPSTFAAQAGSPDKMSSYDITIDFSADEVAPYSLGNRQIFISVLGTDDPNIGFGVVKY